MKLVIIESPYAGNVARNVSYARMCLKDSLARGESPLASHLLYTQPGVLNDEDPAERLLGMQAGWDWMRKAHLVAIYVDLGMTDGMLKGLQYAASIGVPTETRYVRFSELAKLAP